MQGEYIDLEGRIEDFEPRDLDFERERPEDHVIRELGKSKYGYEMYDREPSEIDKAIERAQREPLGVVEALYKKDKDFFEFWNDVYTDWAKNDERFKATKLDCD